MMSSFFLVSQEHLWIVILLSCSASFPLQPWNHTHIASQLTLNENEMYFLSDPCRPCFVLCIVHKCCIPGEVSAELSIKKEQVAEYLVNYFQVQELCNIYIWKGKVFFSFSLSGSSEVAWQFSVPLFFVPADHRTPDGLFHICLCIVRCPNS